MKRSSSWVLALVILNGCAASDENQNAQGLGGPPDPVLAWNNTASQIIVGPGGANKPPPLGLIDLAIVHTAIYDAVNAVDGFPYSVYEVEVDVTEPASSYAAAAAAGRGTLLALYPTRAATIDAAYAASLAYVPDGPEKTNGIAAGEAAAAGIIAARATDGRNAGGTYTPPGVGDGFWVPTPPANAPAQAPWVRNVTPFALNSPDQFRPEAPPSLTSETWINDYNEVKALGAAVGSTRTPEQTDIGKFWGDQPMLQWVRAWRKLATEQGVSLSGNARLFAMLSAGGADALIGCWDAKYNYGFWRPVTAIRAGGGNPELTGDPAWLSQVVTPPHPEYPAAHGCFSGSVLTTLETFFDDDDITFTIDSTFAGVVQTVRTYDSFDDALDEVGNARVYGGMHYRNSTKVGARMGKQISHFVTNHFFREEHGHGHCRGHGRGHGGRGR